MKARHRAPPGYDWEEAERRTAATLLRARNQRALAPASPAGPERWVERGSDNLAGRVHTTHLSTDATRIFTGTSLGGIWEGAPDGTGWAPIADGLYGGAHSLVVLPSEEGGAPDGLIAATDWGSVHRSADGGRTWEPADLPYLTHVKRLIATPGASPTVFLVGGAWEDYTLHRSQDGGRSFHEIQDLGSFQGDVWVPRVGGSEVYLAVDGLLAVSHDLGDTFEPVGSIPTAGTRVDLAGSEAGAPRLWAVAPGDAAVDLYRSDDAGAEWVELHPISDYWGELAASAVDPDLFAVGGFELWRTADGGASFARVNEWWEYYEDPASLLHADVMGIDVGPDGKGGETWFINGDGGLYRSDDGLLTLENLSLRGLRVSQYYSTLTSAADPTHVAAGSQDQGYQLTAGVQQGAERLDFLQWISGDYGHLTAANGTHDWVFSVYPGFVLVQKGETDPEMFFVDYPPDERSEWLPPVVADPEYPSRFFFPGTRLWYYTRSDDAEWTPEPWSETDFGADGDLISALAFSPSDPRRAWLATARGRLFRSEDKGVTWEEAQGPGPEAHYFYGTALLPSRTDADTVYAGGSGYGSPAVWRSTDGGRTFEPYSEGLPDTLVYALAEAPDGSGRLFAGAETAAWRRDPGGEWYAISGVDSPVTIHWSVEALVHENTLRFGTYGRGIWDYQIDPEGVGCYPPVDRDGDGTLCDTDCDDADPAVHPGAAETCDGADGNCDAQDVIETDGDGDGFPACSDCDDARVDVHPGGAEVCGDAADQDCADGDAPCSPCEGCQAMRGPPGRAGWAALAGALAVLGWGTGRRRGRGPPR